MAESKVVGTAFTDGEGGRPEWAYPVCTSAEARAVASQWSRDENDPLYKIIVPGHQGIDPAACLVRVGECMAACHVDIARMRMLDGIDPYAQEAAMSFHKQLDGLTGLVQYLTSLPMPMTVWRRVLVTEGQ